MTVQFLGISFSVKPLAANSLVAILWFAIIVCVLVQPKLGHSHYPTEINRKRNEIVTEIARQIHEHGGGREVAWIFHNRLLPSPNLNIKYYQMYHKFLRQKRIVLFKDVKKAADSADFVLALDNPKAKYLKKRKAWTSNQHAAEVLAIMRKRMDFRLIEKYSILNFNVYLFKKV